MKDNVIAGYAFILVGFALLLFAAYLAYTFFTTDVSHAYSALGQPASSSSLPPGIIGIFFTSAMRSFLYLLVAVLLLIVIAGIGGSLMKHGMALMDLYGGATRSETAEEAAAAEAVRKAKF